MQARTVGTPFLIRRTVSLVAAALAVTLALPAAAGCSSVAPIFPQWDSPQPVGGAGYIRTAFRDDAAGWTHVGDRDLDRAARGIVGTWRFTWISDGTAYPVSIPSGAVVDFGTQQWHDDGTEIIISGSRPPGAGDVCMGSWEPTGPSSYRLKHIALAWANGDTVPPASPATYVGPAIIRASVVLNGARNKFEGTFTLDQYAKDEVTLIQHVAGKVTATRFTVD